MGVNGGQGTTCPPSSTGPTLADSIFLLFNFIASLAESCQAKAFSKA